jgi:hypothetical protein
VRQSRDSSTHRNGELTNGRAERAITQLLSGTDDLITKFCAEFERLRKNFDSGVDVGTTLLLSRTTTTMDVIRASRLLICQLAFIPDWHAGRDQLLLKFKSVDMDEYNRSAYFPRTRMDVIKSITQWIADESNCQKRIIRFYGLAGSGKSTISTINAEIMRDLQRLGAFFFFSRDIPEGTPPQSSGLWHISSPFSMLALAQKYLELWITIQTLQEYP